MTARLSLDPPLAAVLNDVPPTPAEMAAVRFVKEMAAHVDQKHGRQPTRETQKKVASVVREKFYPEPSATSWPTRKPPSVAVQVAEPVTEDVPQGRTGGAHPSTAAFDNACAAIRAYAARTARAKIKSIARYFLAEPWQLDMLRHGFVASSFTPEQLIEFAKELLRQEYEFCERVAPRRVELVPVKNWNARAAILVGRYLRAKARQLARMAAP